MLPQTGPFVLLDDARSGGRQTLYRDPLGEIAAYRTHEIGAALRKLRGAIAADRYVAGYIAYEGGSALAGKADSAEGGIGTPLLWFGQFARRDLLNPAALATMLPDPAGAWCSAPRPLIDRSAYAAAVARLQALIAAGDIYQANLSFRATVPIAGNPLALYARLRAAAGAGWGALVNDGARWLLSFSPELFFRIDGRKIVARPMKGTGARGATPREDDDLAAALAADPKQRAENLMIVDLMRNDIARVARPGSVRVPELFTVERYPTVQQMVSSVEGELADGCDAVDVLAALFPCGSITGAPKLRAMEAIAEVEADARGVYTGAIGAIAPDGTAAFNVAIRTLVLEEGADEARIGLGSAIVADSTADGEWAECLAKGAFVTAGRRPFDLIETLRFDPLEGLIDLERHMTRLEASAGALGFAFDRHALRNELHVATFRLRGLGRVRLRLSPTGAVAIETGPVPAPPPAPVRVAIVPLPVDPADFRLLHKTSDRAFYDDARRAAGMFEVLLRHPCGRIGEGSFTNLFVGAADGSLITPPRTMGLLGGILRERLLAEGRAVEGNVTAKDLADGFFIGNALRGLMPARLA